VTDADRDTADAVINLWKAAPSLSVLFPLPPTWDTVRKTDSKAVIAMPYATLEITKGKDNQRITGGVYYDYRNVTIKIAGSMAPLAPAVQAQAGLPVGPISVIAAAKLAVLSMFNLKLGIPGQPYTLTMPSGARFCRWWPQNDGDIARDPTAKAGQDIWVANVKGEVWSVRTD